MADFKGVSSSFRLNLVNDYGGDNDRVMVQIGMDGLKITTTSDNRTLRSYELSHISRWQSRDNNLVLYIKTPNDMEERQTTLSGDETTIRSALDTLTCCCMQLCELLQSKKTESSQEVANNLHALVAGGGKKKTSLPTADEVEYWRSPDKSGWLQSQAEVLKTWRKRWFVLKQGHLFRFKDTSVSESIKPRGVVDLSKVQDVKAVAGRANSIQLKTSSGSSVMYIADSETEVVEWISAIEGAIQRIVRHAAGMDDDAPPSGSSSKSKSGSDNKNSSSSSHSKPTASSGVTAQQNEWMSQLEKNFEKMASVNNGSSSSSKNNGSGGGGGSSSRNGGNSSSSKNAGPALVNVVGYETISGGNSYGGGGGGGGGGGYGAYGQDSGASSGGRDYSDSRSDSQQYGGGGYGQGSGNSGITGANVISNDRNYSNNSMPQSAAQNDPYRSNPAPTNNDPYGMQRANSQQQQQQQPSYTPSQASLQQQQQQQQQMLAAQQQQQYAANAYAAAGQAQQYSQQPQQQQQQQAQQGYGGSGSVSLMDQIPQQQPAYPYYQHTATAPQQPTASPSGWQIHHTAEGRPYYYNSITGTTTWETPVGVTM